MSDQLDKIGEVLLEMKEILEKGDATDLKEFLAAGGKIDRSPSKKGRPRKSFTAKPTKSVGGVYNTGPGGYAVGGEAVPEGKGKANRTLNKDEDPDASIRAKIQAEMDKRKFGEADATRHIIDRDRGDKMPKPPKQVKPLLQSEQEVCKTDSNGQWKIEKSNYGPKGMGLYNENDNAKRKAKNTGDVVEDAGKNVNVKSYTTSGSSMSAAAEVAENKRRKKNPAPVKTITLSPEEKARYEAEANKKK